MRHVFFCLLTPSSDIWVSVRFPCSFFPSSLLPERFFTRSLATSTMKLPPIDRNAGSSSWSECVKQSESFHFRPPDRPLPSYLDPDPALSQKLALKYERWSCASENILLSKCETETSDRKRFLGRGSETNFRLKSVVQRILPGESCARCSIRLQLFTQGTLNP